jgi:hypothetical protein
MVIMVTVVLSIWRAPRQQHAQLRHRPDVMLRMVVELPRRRAQVKDYLTGFKQGGLYLWRTR